MEEVGEDERYEEAARWWEAIQSGDLVDDEAFQAWLNADSHNRKVLEDFRAGWQTIQEHAVSPELLAARSEALDDVRRHAANRWKKSTRPDRRALFGGLAATLVLVPAVGFFAFSSARAEEYQTGLDEQRNVTLPDNSQLFLDAESHVRLRFTHTERHLEMLSGRAHFAVTYDRSRPLRVVVGGATVTALGTQFVVENRDANVSVLLAEGTVAIECPGREAIYLKPGQLFTLASGNRSVVQANVDLGREMAWQQGRLVFENERLDRAASRMNDYSATKIVVADQKVAGLKLTGTFIAGKSQSFVDAVQSYFPVIAERDGSTVTLRSRT